MNQAKQILMSKLRSKTLNRSEFAHIAHQVGSLLAFESLNCIPVKAHLVTTPIDTYQGITPEPRIVLVTILRSGLALLKTFSELYPDASIGFLGCERNAQSNIVTIYYKKLPALSEHDYVIILDPVLATGVTAVQAITMLVGHGAQQKNILFVSMIAYTDGLKYVRKEYPPVMHITASIDAHITEDSMIRPGLGDFGDRYFL